MIYLIKLAEVTIQVLHAVKVRHLSPDMPEEAMTNRGSTHGAGGVGGGGGGKPLPSLPPVHQALNSLCVFYVISIGARDPTTHSPPPFPRSYSTVMTVRRVQRSSRVSVCLCVYCSVIRITRFDLIKHVPGPR